MKLTKIIMGCTLAAGLMAFAPDQAQAVVNTNLNTTLYAPLNIKGTVTYQSILNGSFKKMSYTSVTLLQDLGYGKTYSLALGPNNHVFVINKKTKAVIVDLSSNETVTASVSTTPLITADTTRGGTVSDTELGTIGLTFNTTSTHATGQPS